MSKQLHSGAPVDDVVSVDQTTAAVSAPPAITFSSVSVTYRRGREATVALADFTLRVAAGETVALLGPSGSGKSTALKALAGFVTPSRGRVLLGDRDVTDLPPAQRGIGVVVQSYALFPHMTVAQNVAFGLRARRRTRDTGSGGPARPRFPVPARRAHDIHAAVTEVLAMVGMTDYATRLPRELSGGQQQRVAIARALAIKPDVLLLDEPLAALDARLRQSMIAELQQLRSALPATAMLYVTHDQGEALALADRIAIMRDARLIDVDTAQRLWDSPPSDFSATFLGGANLIDCTVGRVYGTSALVSVGDRMLSALAHPSATGAQRWAPGTAAYLCIRPHDVQLCSPTDSGALAARVSGTVWRGGTTRVTVRVDDLPDTLVDVDVAGRADYPHNTRVGVTLPASACVLVERGVGR